MTAATLENAIRACGRQAYQRTTVYGRAAVDEGKPEPLALNF
jgi:hypothetical protein